MTEAANRNDGLDFEDLVNRYYRDLYRFAFSLARSEAEASDLTQQTFQTWAMKGNQLRDAAKVKTWLFTTLHRHFLNQQRHRGRFTHVPLEEAGPDLPSVAPALIRELDGDAVLEALDRIDELFRAPVALFYLEAHSYKEIAEILDVPVGTVQSRIARGKAQLQNLLLESTVPGRQEGTPERD